MRVSFATVLFTCACAFVVGLDVSGREPEPKKEQKQKEAPKSFKPDEATLAKIKEQTRQLHRAINELRKNEIEKGIVIEVEIFLKAAENIVRFEEWSNANSGKWTLQTLEQGLQRARLAEGGKAVWRDAPGKWVVRAYRSKIDDSIQPYAVLLPHDYGKDPKKKWRLDLVLHGRDDTLTEAKFIANHGPNGKAPNDLDSVQLEPYGRGNNAYRWAGERDVFEAGEGFILTEEARLKSRLFSDASCPRILRGFSMGGAGTWHIGLHYPFVFNAIGPGAGFSATHGYAGGLPKVLPECQEKCLSIYDAVDYAENAFDIPIIAYSGSIDPQKAAADNIEQALADFKEPFQLKRLIAPGLAHQMPREWMEKAEAEYKKYAGTGRTIPDRVRFVTYTTRYNDFGHGYIGALEHLYEKAVIDSTWANDVLTAKTQNIALFAIKPRDRKLPAKVIIDGQDVSEDGGKDRSLAFERIGGKWKRIDEDVTGQQKRKKAGGHAWIQGPIDDAFTSGFEVSAPSAEGWHPALTQFLTARRERFAIEWGRYFRGNIPELQPDANPLQTGNMVLFGDPQSNPLIAKALPGLPITWTKEKLVVNGVQYDARTHIPVLIYPNPLNPLRYLVLNSGHTFSEADLKGTNALLFPHLGDWAVLKPAPTAKNPTAYEVVAAGLFDEFWQFKK